MNHSGTQADASKQNEKSGLQQPSKSRKPGWVAISLATIGVFGVLVLACSSIGLWLVTAGGEVLAEEIIVQVENDPNFVAKIGSVTSQSFDWYRTMIEFEEQDRVVFSIEGSKGAGTVIADSYADENNIEQVYYAILKTDDGREFQLQIDNGAPYRQ